jgi:hypothetical protein
MEQPANCEQAAHESIDQVAAVAKIEEVFTAFGNAILQLEKEQQAIRQTLNLIISERSQLVDLVTRLSAQVTSISDVQEKSSGAIVALGNLLPAVDSRIQQLSIIADQHRELFLKHGWMTPRPKVDPLAN